LQGGAPARAYERYVPLYEAKMMHQFDHRWATYDDADNREPLCVPKTRSVLIA